MNRVSFILSLILFSSCTTLTESGQRIPDVELTLKPLERDQYVIGPPIQGKATVTIKRGFGNKILAPIFGDYTVVGDQSSSTLFGAETSKYRIGEISHATINSQISKLISQVSSLGVSSKAAQLAVSAAYYEAMEKQSDIDFLLHPKVKMIKKEFKSFFFFVEDEETVSVVVYGKPVMVVTN